MTERPTGAPGSGPDPTTAAFEQERPRLVALADRVLGDHAEAQDVVQQAWLRLDGTGTVVENLPAWLTTVTTRLCLDRLKARTPLPVEVLPEPSAEAAPLDPSEQLALADSVGVALQVVLDRLTPPERVAFVLHDSFGFEFPTVAAVLGTTPAAARKLGSRGRAKLAGAGPDPFEEEWDALADWQVVDAFMEAAREGRFEALLELLAPDVALRADAAAAALGTPERIDGRQDVASFFNGSAHTALPVMVGARPASAWFQRGVARVLFDFTLEDGRVRAITFRAAAETLAQVVRRDGAVVRR